VSTDQDIHARLEELRRARGDLEGLRARWEALQTVERARADYEQLTADQAARLDGLRRRKQELEAECYRLSQGPAEEAGEEPAPFPEPDVPPAAPRPSAWQEPPARPAGPGAAGPGRQLLKRLVNRWQHAWGLAAALVGQVNRIADDADRPLGEALLLLPWGACEGRVAGETAQARQARLTEWRDALREYHVRLAAEIDIFETRFRGWLGIWELWLRRHEGAEGQARWATFLDQKRRATAQEIAGLEGEVAALEARLRQARGRP
jgi:hypothetical protein